jgi:putative ABC transport system permease protein
MKLATALIRLLGLLAPRAMRDRWTEEWRAEIEHAADRSEGRRWRAVRVWRFALGAIPDIIGLHRLPRVVVADRSAWLNGVRQDFRHAARNLSGAPGFTATVVVSLSLGIVVVTGAYAFINAALFPTLPGVVDQDRLIEIYMERSALDERAALRDAIPGVRDVAATLPMSFALSARDQVLSVHGALVSANYFEVLGTRMRPGRGFLEREDHPADGAVAVLASTLSRRLFGDEPPVGALITVGGHPVQIVGVAEDRFTGTYRTFDGVAELWVAFGMADRLTAARLARDELPGRPPAAAGEFPLTHIVRVSPDASVQQAVSHARVAAPRLIAARLATGRRQPFARVRPVARDDTGNMAFGVILVLLVPCLVLLIGCINAATLLLARGTQRARDIAVRLALGASRWRIVRHLLAESVLLALVAAAVTVPVLSWTLSALERVVPVRWAVDWRVVGFAVLVSFSSVLVFGLAPAVRLSATRGGAATGSLRVGEMPRRSRTRQVLVAVQVALSLGLLATGSQLVSAVRHLSGVTGAIDPSRLLMVSFDLSQLNTPEDRANAFYQGLLERVERIPGVERAGLAALTRYGRSAWAWATTTASSSGRRMSRRPRDDWRSEATPGVR